MVPSWPVHTNEPVKQYKAVDIPDYSVDFATYQPMEPQVSLHPVNPLVHPLGAPLTLPMHPLQGLHVIAAESLLLFTL